MPTGDKEKNDLDDLIDGIDRMPTPEDSAHHSPVETEVTRELDALAGIGKDESKTTGTPVTEKAEIPDEMKVPGLLNAAKDLSTAMVGLVNASKEAIDKTSDEKQKIPKISVDKEKKPKTSVDEEEQATSIATRQQNPKDKDESEQNLEAEEGREKQNQKEPTTLENEFKMTLGHTWEDALIFALFASLRVAGDVGRGAPLIAKATVERTYKDLAQFADKLVELYKDGNLSKKAIAGLIVTSPFILVGDLAKNVLAETFYEPAKQAFSKTKQSIESGEIKNVDELKKHVDQKGEELGKEVSDKLKTLSDTKPKEDATPDDLPGKFAKVAGDLTLLSDQSEPSTDKKIIATPSVAALAKVDSMLDATKENVAKEKKEAELASTPTDEPSSPRKSARAA